MANEGLAVSYNEDLQPLEKLLRGVRRSGDFFVSGAVTLPLPKVEIEGVGVLSFPVPEEQIGKIIKCAERAPYGRGPDTIVDTSVRKVWQIPTSKVQITSKTWEENFGHIIGAVAQGLGCGKATVVAELYKLLIYEKDGFFLAHRDTEKVAGMFGTLVLVLPSAHRGGELIVRHGGREVTLNLSSSEASEVTYGAFYADCEHEVRPVTEGNRVCLVYNLIHQTSKTGTKSKQPVSAPLYEKENQAAAAILEAALSGPEAPAKLTWLLEHQYTSAELSFATLKNADAARAKVLSEAASRAGCAIHLGIVHLEESGAAESSYGDYGYYGRRSRSRWSRHNEETDETDDSEVNFEVVEVYDSSQYVDDWVDLNNQKVAFGKVPLADGELLPQGALDDEKPDSKRYMEASGNEGASFERAYHRAAVVIWRKDRYAEVLLQAGVGAAIPYLKQRVQAAKAATGSKKDRDEALKLAKLLLARWRPGPEDSCPSIQANPPDRAEMLKILCEIEAPDLIERFIADVIIGEYDGSENAALGHASKLLAPTAMGSLLIRLVGENMRWFHQACVDLLARLVKLKPSKSPAAWQKALWEAGAVAVEKLGEIKNVLSSSNRFVETVVILDDWDSSFEQEQDDQDKPNWKRRDKIKPVDSTLVIRLLAVLADLDALELREKAAETIGSRPKVFDPVTVVVPALVAIHETHRAGAQTDAAFLRLWRGPAGLLLARSEHPPEPPRDWQQEVTVSCRCEDCRGLERFAKAAAERVHRFSVNKDRRQHLHVMIGQHKLDMTHVTERKGSPQTLVCTKTRRKFENRREQYKQEIAAMSALVPFLQGVEGEPATLSARLTAAIARSRG